MENRSFDYMLGFMKRDNPLINGLIGNEWNYPAAELPNNVIVSPDAGDVEDPNPDPNHEFAHVTLQISSTDDPVGNPDMKGSVRDYYADCNDATHAAGIMKCFTPETLPILSTLARQYAVCDRWFASVPGSTIPNRLFVHGASSAGSITQDVIAAPFALHTVFESFDATTPYDYAIYTSGSSILLANQYLIQHQDKFRDYTNFESDAINGDLPAYTFIEPCYDDGDGLFANSQHPDFPGVRVPAVFISPCIPPGTVINDRDYEHASVDATVRKFFCPGSQPLNWREAKAQTFDSVLTLTGSAIRSDVVNLPDAYTSAGIDISASAAEPIPRTPTDLSVLMAGAMQYSLVQRGLQPPGDYSILTNSAQVTAFLQKAQQISKAEIGTQ
jgi:hypothetical protein